MDNVSTKAAISVEFFHLNTELNKNLKQFASSFDGLLQNIKSDPEQYNNSKGISFLSLKNMLMIEYLNNLMQVIYFKTTGQKLSGDQSIFRLAELRTVLEKSKSIEAKLKYQIDKLLKIASNNRTDEHDPLSFKPNLANFSDQNDQDDKITDEEDVDNKESVEEKHSSSKPDGLYRPPKHVPVYNDIDETPEDRARNQIERIKMSALRSSIIKDLESEYSGAPEEIKNNYANILGSETREEKHKKEYEEDYFVRKPMTKTEMIKARRLQKGTNLNSLSSFDDARLLLDENINMDEFLKSRREEKKGKRKSSGGKKDKKGKKKGGKKIRYT